MALIQVDADEYRKLKEQVSVLAADKSRIDLEIVRLGQLAEKLRLETGSFRQSLDAPAQGIKEFGNSIANTSAELLAQTSARFTSINKNISTNTTDTITDMKIGETRYVSGRIFNTDTTLKSWTLKVLNTVKLVYHQQWLITAPNYTIIDLNSFSSENWSGIGTGQIFNVGLPGTATYGNFGAITFFFILKRRE